MVVSRQHVYQTTAGEVLSDGSLSRHKLQAGFSAFIPD